MSRNIINVESDKISKIKDLPKQIAIGGGHAGIVFFKFERYRFEVQGVFIFCV